MTGVPSFDIRSKPPPAPRPQKSLYGNPAEMDVLLEAARTSIPSGCIILRARRRAQQPERKCAKVQPDGERERREQPPAPRRPQRRCTAAPLQQIS